MTYRYSIWCTDREQGCPNGCFDGGAQFSAETYPTMREAWEAGYVACRKCPGGISR